MHNEIFPQKPPTTLMAPICLLTESCTLTKWFQVWKESDIAPYKKSAGVSGSPGGVETCLSEPDMMERVIDAL